MDHHEAKQRGAEEAGQHKPADIYALEVCFLGVVGLVVVAAFLEAFTYKLVSSRTPFVIMAPLLLLIGFQARRLFAVRDRHQWREPIRRALRGDLPGFRKIVVLNGWFVLLLGLIQIAGHYAAITFFMFMLTWYVAKERLLTSLILTAVMTLAVFVLFEEAFNIELYRGLIFRFFAGYRVF